ncbi:MAG: xanthine dehydrogenase family protein molybdopterin-binding subunit [Planctomycetota bacterium]
MTLIGKSPPRFDGWAKVCGEARYTDDLTMPGMLFGATCRSPHPHARVKALRIHAEKAPEGAFWVTARDIPGKNGVLLLDDTWTALADSTVNYAGEPLALVAASTKAAARAALEAIEVEYEPLAPALTWAEAERLEPLCKLDLVNGDVEQGLAAADLVVEGEYQTGHQEHIYIECQGVLAWFDEQGILRVAGSLQCPYFVRNALVHALAVPPERISVKPATVGGGFGGKEDFPSLLAIHAALLARASGRPVKMVYDRHEDIVCTTKRHPSRIRHRTGVMHDGRLVAMEIEVTLDGGAYRTLSPVVLSRAVIHATGPYRCPNVRVRGRVLRTHTAPNGAFRGFGAPQVQFAAERQIDRVGRALGLDPYEIRKRNVVGPGDTLAPGQRLDESAAAPDCLERAVATTNFPLRWRSLERARARREDGDLQRGIGLSLFFHGAGFTGLGEHRMRSPVKVRLREDGRIEILTSMTEMGQGAATVLLQIAAEAAGVALEDVVLHEPDTAVVPDSGPTVASRTTMVVGGTIVRAVRELRERVVQAAAAREGVPFRELAREHFREHGATELTVRHEPPAWQEFDEATYHGAAYATYGWGADVVEVTVDPDTFEVTPKKVISVCEVGRVINETLCKGQVEGGTLQAIGWALLEEMKLEKGHHLNDRLATYIVPTSVDAPEMEVHLLEKPWDGGSFGAKGVGELPMDGGAPAVMQAIENATGIALFSLPATPERLFEAWSATQGAAHATVDLDQES